MSRIVITARLLQDLVNAAYVPGIISEARLRAGTMGLTLSAIDAANVVFVSASLNASAYEGDIAETAVGVDLRRLNEIIGNAGSEDKITLTLENKKMRLGYGRFSYSISLIAVSSLKQEPSLAKLNLPASASLNGSLLRDLVRESGKVGEKAKFILSDKSLDVVAEGELDNFTAEIPASELIDVKVDADVSYQSGYSVSVLEKLSRVLGRSERITMSMGDDKPVRLLANIAGGNGTVTYVVAPYIEES